MKRRKHLKDGKTRFHRCGGRDGRRPVSTCLAKDKAKSRRSERRSAKRNVAGE